MNDFSLLGRLLGALYNRSPVDTVLAPVLQWIQSSEFIQKWPLEQNELLSKWVKAIDFPVMEQDFQQLFITPDTAISRCSEDYGAMNQQHCQLFLEKLQFPLGQQRADQFGILLSASSWIEDHSQSEERTENQTRLFDEYLLPWAATFLGKVESHAQSQFYRLLAQITREALQAMYDELNEPSLS